MAERIERYNGLGSVVWANGDTKSGAIDLGGAAMAWVQAPAGWGGAASCTLEVWNGAAWVTAKDSTGAAFAIVMVASEANVLPSEVCVYGKVRLVGTDPGADSTILYGIKG